MFRISFNRFLVEIGVSWRPDVFICVPGIGQGWASAQTWEVSWDRWSEVVAMEGRALD